MAGRPAPGADRCTDGPRRRRHRRGPRVARVWCGVAWCPWCTSFGSPGSPGVRAARARMKPRGPRWSPGRKYSAICTVDIGTPIPAPHAVWHARTHHDVGRPVAAQHGSTRACALLSQLQKQPGARQDSAPRTNHFRRSGKQLPRRPTHGAADIPTGERRGARRTKDHPSIRRSTPPLLVPHPSSKSHAPPRVWRALDTGGRARACLRGSVCRKLWDLRARSDEAWVRVGWLDRREGLIQPLAPFS